MDNSQTGYAKGGTMVFALSQIVNADFALIEELQVTVHLTNGTVIVVSDIDAIELAMTIKPSVLESKRLRWPKYMWMIHNIIGHPVMQILALCRCYRAAFTVHDVTVPKPIGRK